MARICDSRIKNLVDGLLFNQDRWETPLWEAKARLPHLKVPRERAEFIRDCIAMGNTVRRLRRRGYLIFGIDESRTVIDQGKEDVYGRLTDVGLEKAMETNEASILRLLQSHVQPNLDIELYYCWSQGYVGPLHDTDVRSGASAINVGTVVCLEFRPMPVPPYVVKKGFEYEIDDKGQKRRRQLRTDSSWTRFGTSKGDELRPEQHYLLVRTRL